MGNIEWGRGGGVFNNLEHDSNYSVILHLKKNCLNTVSTNFVADCSL